MREFDKCYLLKWTAGPIGVGRATAGLTLRTTSCGVAHQLIFVFVRKHARECERDGVCGGGFNADAALQVASVVVRAAVLVVFTTHRLQNRKKLK